MANLLWPLVLLVFSTSCVAHRGGTARDTNENTTVRAQARDVSPKLVESESRVTAGGDVYNQDAWTLRLLGLGLVLLGLSYPVGKIIWLLTAALRRKAGAIASAARAGERLGDIETLFPFRAGSEPRRNP